jgi:hypothetical protein
MGGVVPPLPQCAVMAWCSVRGRRGTSLTRSLFANCSWSDLGYRVVEWDTKASLELLLTPNVASSSVSEFT